MKRMFFLPALILTAVSLAACDYPAEFSSPISELGVVPYDERLVGAWYIFGGDEDEFSFGALTAKPRKDGFLDVIGFLAGNETGSYRSEGNGDREFTSAFTSLRWTAHASIIDNQTYFNARIVDSAFFQKKITVSIAKTHSLTHGNTG